MPVPELTPETTREVERVRERFERLLAAGTAIVSLHDLQQVLDTIVASARDVVGARYAALGVIAEDGRGLSAFLTAGLTDEERQRIANLPTGKGLLGLLIRRREPLRIPRIGDHPEAHGFPPNHPPMASFLGVPIVSHGQVFGNLYLTEKIAADEFTAEDERIAILLAAQAAAAIENVRLYEETTALLAQVRTMQRQRDQFFAMINHELRNALTGVYGWAEQLQRSRTAAGTERATKEIYESAERTIILMNNLLDLSRLDAGQVQVVTRDVAVAAAVARAVSQVQPLADAKPVLLRTEIPDPAPRCPTDSLRLEQILHNLLSNAIRHSSRGDEVVVRVEETPGELIFSVIDRGTGIPEEDLGRIFEPFIRHDPESGLGSGLGLPVSRRLAEVLGGRLTVHSRLGAGATFTLSLPRTPPHEDAS